MTRHPNPPLPAQPFSLLLLEGSDERVVCQKVSIGGLAAKIHCWVANGRDDLPAIAELVRSDPNFPNVQGVGIVLDAEDSLAATRDLAGRTLAPLGVTAAVVHSQWIGAPLRASVFIAPDGVSTGSIEGLCRRAVRNPALAACVDQLMACSGHLHSTAGRADKGWLKAYFATLDDSDLRFYQGFNHADGIDPAHAAFDGLRSFLAALGQ